MVDGRVHDNAMEPREGRGVTAKRARVTQCSHERFLHDVFGLIADVSCGDSAQLSARAFVQLRQSGSHDSVSPLRDGVPLVIASRQGKGSEKSITSKTPELGICYR
jgi:hypothetical protein